MFFFFNDTATTEIYTLSLHDALPISTFSWHQGEMPSSSAILKPSHPARISLVALILMPLRSPKSFIVAVMIRSEEHTSELQSRENLVCRLLLEKKKQQ